MRIAPPFLAPAWWQSGYVADCKSVNAGSIPAQASTRRQWILHSCLRKERSAKRPRLAGRSTAGRDRVFPE